MTTTIEMGCRGVGRPVTRCCGDALELDPDGSPMFVYCQEKKGHIESNDNLHSAVVEGWSDRLGKLPVTITWRFP